MAKIKRERRSRWSGRLLLILGLLGLVLIGTAVAIGIYIYTEATETIPPEELLKTGKAHMRLQHWSPAYSNLSAAAKERPTDPEYQWPAAQIAARVGKSLEAIDFARRAWENGKRDIDVLVLRVALLPGDDEAGKLETAREWLAELPDSPEKTEAEANILLRFNELEAARDILEPLVAEAPTADRIASLSQAYIRLGEADAALTLLRTYREQGLINQFGYTTLLALLAVQSNINDIRDLAEEAHLNGYDSDQFSLQYGLVLMGWRQGEAALEQLQPLANGYRLRLEDFSNLQGFLSNLSIAETPMLEFLHSALPVEMQETLATFAMGEDDHPALERSFLNPLIQYLRTAIASDAFMDEVFLSELDLPNELLTRLRDELPPPEEAQLRRQILEATLGDYVQHHVLDLLAHQARLGISLFRAAQNDPGQIQSLRAWASGEGRALEGERLFYDYLRMAINQEEGRQEQLERARALLDGRGVPVIFAAREALHAGNPQEAIQLYRRVFQTEPLLARGPLITMEVASALAAGDQEEEALALVYVLLRRGDTSRRIFEMIRDLEQNPERREAAMTQLRKMYPDDPKVRLDESMVRIREDDLDTALSTLEELMQEYPDEKNIEVMALMVLLEKGEFEKALEEADKSEADPAVLAPVRARAYTRLNRIEEAKEQYRIGLEGREGDAAAPLALEFANLLLVQGEFDQAEPLYKQALQTLSSNPVANLGLATIYMQRGERDAARPLVETVTDQDEPIAYAYLLQSELDLADRDLTAALANIERALNITSDYPAARLLRSNILLQMGRLEGAERGLERFLKDMPGHIGARGQLAVVKSRLRKFDEALALVDGILEEQPDNPTLRLFKLEIFLMAERPEGAREALEAVRETIPEELARLHESTILRQEDKLEEAITLLEPHIDDDPQTLMQWTTFQILNNAPDKAWERLAERDLPWQSWFRIATMANARQQHRLAALTYRKALEQRGDDPVILNNFAWSAHLAGDVAEEEEIIGAVKKAFEAQPDQTAILDTYVAVLAAFDHQAELADLLDGRDDDVENRPRILLNGARAFAAEDRPEEAMRYYDMLLELDVEPWPLPVPRETIEEERNALQEVETAPQS